MEPSPALPTTENWDQDASYLAHREGVDRGDVQLARLYKTIDAQHDWRAERAARIERKMAELAKLRDEFIG